MLRSWLKGCILRLLLTCHRDPFLYTGGSEEVIRSLSLQLAKNGHHVTVATKAEPGVPYHAIYDEHGISMPYVIGRVPTVSVLSFASNGHGPFVTNRHLSDFFASGWDAAVLYGQNVWITDEIWRDVGGSWWKLLRAGKIVYFPVGFMGMQRKGSLSTWPARVLYYHIVQDHLIERSDIVVALTDYELQNIPRVGKPKQLVKIPNGVSYSRFQHYANGSSIRSRFGLPGGPLIINVGGDYANKRLSLACEGVRELGMLMPSTERPMLVLIGQGTERYTSASVFGLGVISEADKVALYHEASMLLSTSDFEGFGLVFVEALASGIPFVSTAVGVAPELAAQFGGHIIQDSSPQAVAHAMWREMDSERDADELRTVAKSYDWQLITAQLEKVLA